MITTFGYFAIGVLCFAVFLTFRILKRLNDKGCFAFGYIFLLIFGVISIFLSTSSMTLQSLDTYINGKTYTGIIVDYKSYEKEYKDSNNSNRKTISTMHIPVIEFTADSNQKMRLESSTHSGDVPIVGDSISISYSNGESTVLEHSFITYFLLLGGLAFAIIFGFLTFGIVKYAFGFAMDGFKNQLVKGLLLGFKICLVLFAIAFILPIYDFLSGKSNMPLWAFIVCLVSFLVLIIVCYTFFIKKEKK